MSLFVPRPRGPVLLVDHAIDDARRAAPSAPRGELVELLSAFADDLAEIHAGVHREMAWRALEAEPWIVSAILGTWDAWPTLPDAVVPARLRPLFDRLDSPNVERYGSTIRVRGPRASEQLAVVTRCHTRDVASVVDWMLQLEASHRGEDADWYADLLVGTLGDAAPVKARARDRVQPVLSRSNITDADAAIALRWAPVLDGEAIDVWTAILASDAAPALRASALASLGARDRERAGDQAHAIIAGVGASSSGADNELLQEALVQLKHLGDVNSLDALADLVIELGERPDERAEGTRITHALRCAVAILEGVDPDGVTPRVRARYAAAMRGAWWSSAYDSDPDRAMAVLGYVQPP